MSFLRRLFGSGNGGRRRQTTLELERLEGRILLSGNNWTVMLYMMGDNDLAGYIDEDLNGLESVDLQGATVVVQADTPGHTRRGPIVHDMNPLAVTSPLETLDRCVDMGDADELRGFLEWTATNHPADRYALVLWDHGFGFGGVGEAERLEVSELRLALEQSGTTVDVVSFDACLMGMAEVAYEISDVVGYMTGSEARSYKIWGGGFYGGGFLYGSLLGALAADPEMSPLTFSEHVVSSYGSLFNYLNFNYVNPGVGGTQSAINLRRMEGLTQALDELADTAIAEYSTAVWDEIRDAVSAAQVYGTAIADKAPYNNFRDLGQYLAYLSLPGTAITNPIRLAAQNALSALQQAVVANWTSLWTSGEGLSAYLPDLGDSLTSTFGRHQLRLLHDNDWLCLVARLTDRFAPYFGNVRLTNGIDRDGDGYLSELTLEVDVDSNFSGEVIVQAYGDAGGGEIWVGFTGRYTVEGTQADYRVIEIKADQQDFPRGVYDLRLDLRGLDGKVFQQCGPEDEAILASVRLEPPAEDQPAPEHPDYVAIDLLFEDSGHPLPDPVHSDSTIWIHATTKNAGEGSASNASVTKFYLSPDQQITGVGNDIFVGGYSPVPALGSGKSYSKWVEIPLIGMVPAGDYYVGAIADTANHVEESDESNNTGVSAGMLAVVPPAVDYVVDDVALGSSDHPLPDRVYGDSTIWVSATTRNAGDAAASSSSRTVFYISPDSNITGDGNDLQIGAVHLPLLGAGDSAAPWTPVVLPGFSDGGDYWVGAIADGRGELVESDECNNAAMTPLHIEPIGAGAFGYRRDYHVADAEGDIVTADFTGDGQVDILVTMPSSQAVKLFPAQADGTFGQAGVYSVGVAPFFVESGDFNHDGIADIAMTTSGWNLLAVRLGPDFSAGADYATDPDPWGVAAGDFNADGVADLAVATADHDEVNVFYGVGDGSFSGREDYAAGDLYYGYARLAAGDFDGDGLDDLAVSNFFDDTISVLWGRVEGGFGGRESYGTGQTPHTLVSDDFNADGYADLAVTNAHNDSVTIYYGGAGGLGSRDDYAVGCNPYGIVADDFNLDGHPDLAVVNHDSSANDVTVLFGQVAGGFGDRQDIAVGSRPTYVASADFSGDGHPDLAVLNENDADVSVLFWVGDNQAPCVSLLSPENGVSLNDVAPTFTWQVSDAGGDPVSSSLYISDDGTPYTDPIGVWNVGPDDVYTLLPSESLTAGSYSWGVRVSDGIAPAVSSGIRWLTVSAYPDVVITAPSALTLEVECGESITIGVTVENVGDAAAFLPENPHEPWSVTLYLSTDNSFSVVEDTAIAEYGLTRLDALSSYTATLTLNVPASGGVYYVSAVADGIDAVPESDELNNWGEVIRLSAPSVGVDLQASSDSGVSDTDNITNDNTPTYDVTVNVPGTIEIDWDNDETVDVTDVVAVAGTYQYTPDSALDEGVYPVSVTFTDAAWGVATASDPTTIDRTAPDVPGAPGLQSGSDSGVASDDDITNAASPVFDVASTDSYFRFYREGGRISGNYESGTSYTAGSEPAGARSYTVSGVDAAGNESGQSAGLDITIDRTAPDVPGAPGLQPGSDSGVASDDDITNVDSPTFGVASTDSYFRFYREGGQISAHYEGGASYTAASEPAGARSYTLSGVDAAGNESGQSAGLDVTIDRTAPGAPVAPDLRTGSDTGISSSDNITSDRTPTLGLSGFGTYWRLERHGGQTGTDYGTATRFEDGPLGYGGYSYVLYAVDAAGNVSDGSDALDIIVQFAVEHGAVSINHQWQQVGFTEDFTDPVVVAGAATYHGSDPGVVRVRNVTEDSFEVRFQEWNYKNRKHTREQIHWLAVERGTWDLGGGNQLVAGSLNTGNTNMNSPTAVDFSTAFGSAPAVFAQVQTFNGRDAVTDRISGVTASRFKLVLQEEEAKGKHRTETVGYIALSQDVTEITGINCDVGTIPGVTHLSSLVPGIGWRVWVSEEKSKDSEIAHTGEKVGYVSFGSDPPMLLDMQTTYGKDTANLRCAPFVEHGTVSANDKWRRVNFSKDFVDPVVVAGPATDNKPGPGVVRVRDVTEYSFEVRFQEWNYKNGRHGREKIHWIAAERGTWDLGDGNQLVAGTLKTDNTNMDSPTAVAFSNDFGSAPAVFAQVQTFDGRDAVTDRISAVTASGFSVALQEEEAGGKHKRERVGYIALSPGLSQITGINCDVGSIAAVTQLPSAVPGTAWDLWVSEEKSKDKETDHAAEKVAYISFERDDGLIADMQTVNERDTANLRYE